MVAEEGPRPDQIGLIKEPVNASLMANGI